MGVPVGCQWKGKTNQTFEGAEGGGVGGRGDGTV